MSARSYNSHQKPPNPLTFLNPFPSSPKLLLRLGQRDNKLIFCKSHKDLNSWVCAEEWWSVCQCYRPFLHSFLHCLSLLQERHIAETTNPQALFLSGWSPVNHDHHNVASPTMGRPLLIGTRRPFERFEKRVTESPRNSSSSTCCSPECATNLFQTGGLWRENGLNTWSLGLLKKMPKLIDVVLHHGSRHRWTNPPRNPRRNSSKETKTFAKSRVNNNPSKLPKQNFATPLSLSKTQNLQDPKLPYAHCSKVLQKPQNLPSSPTTRRQRSPRSFQEDLDPGGEILRSNKRQEDQMKTTKKNPFPEILMRSTVAAGMAHPFTQFLFCSSTRKKKALASLAITCNTHLSSLQCLQFLEYPFFPCNTCKYLSSLQCLQYLQCPYLPCNACNG